MKTHPTFHPNWINETAHQVVTNRTKNMKVKLLVATIATLSMVGCATGPNAQTDAVIGGLLGATAGGIIGHQSGRGLEGGPLGAGIGALAGNAFGNGVDQRQNNRHQPQYHQSAPEPRYYQQAPVYIQPTPEPVCYHQTTVYQY